MRKLRSFLLALLLVPAAAYSLGLGDIHLHSGLNQPLSAEIDLLSVGPDDVPSIVASLASNDAFVQMGLDRPMALMAVEFTVEQRPGGTYFIKAVTDRPVREPFLDFLLEVNWRAGRLLREYTLLLDPPELMKKEAPPAVRAPVTTAGVRAPAAARAVAAPAAAGKTGTAARGTALTYGPVKGNETLWSIANKMRPNSSTTVPQVMMALLKGNPQAFEDNNVNRLKAGTVLRLDPAQLQAMSRAEAAREIARQDRQWQDFKQQAAGKAKGRTPAGEAAIPRSAAAVKTEEPRLKLVAPEAAEAGKTDSTGASADGAQALEGLKQELLLAQEASEASRQESEELRTRVQELEGQITSMQRLLSLKDDDLATLQRQLGSAGAAGPAVEPVSPDDAATASGTEATPAPVAAGAETLEAAPEAADAETVPQAAGGEKPVEAVVAADAAPAQEPKAEEPKPARKPAAKKRVVPPAPPPEPSLVDTLLANTLLANPVYAGLLLLLGLALITLIGLVIRRRRTGSNFTESILMGGTPSMMKAKAAEGKQGEESSFFSDFAVSGMGDIQAEDSEVDPLTEADVYMAYQRYQQAEDLVKDALKHNPERPELHVKLLEVYHATKDRTKFEAQALKTHALLNGSGPLWDKVLVLGHELLPDHALFTRAPDVPAAGPDHADARLDNEVLDIGLDLDALTEEMESGGNGDFNLDLGVDFSDLEELAPKKAAAPARAGSAAAAEEPSFDLDLDALASEPEPASRTAAKADTGLDFDLGALSLDEPAGVAETEPAAAAVPDFDLGGISLEDPAGTTDTASADFDLGELSLGGPEPTPSTPTPAKEDGGLDLESFDLGSLDLGTLDSESMGGLDVASLDTEPNGALDLADMELPEQDGADDLLFGDINEVDTKLDLARAYVGMGDSDGARNLLDEVMEEGDAAQKQQAEELLKQIG